MATKFITTDEVYQQLFDAGVITIEPKMVRRCVIDLEHGSAARVYVEQFADREMIGVLLHSGLEQLPNAQVPISPELREQLSGEWSWPLRVKIEDGLLVFKTEEESGG